MEERKLCYCWRDRVLGEPVPLLQNTVIKLSWLDLINFEDL